VCKFVFRVIDENLMVNERSKNKRNLCFLLDILSQTLIVFDLKDNIEGTRYFKSYLSIKEKFIEFLCAFLNEKYSVKMDHKDYHEFFIIIVVYFFSLFDSSKCFLRLKVQFLYSL